MNFHKLKENDSIHSPFFYIPPDTNRLKKDNQSIEDFNPSRSLDRRDYIHPSEMAFWGFYCFFPAFFASSFQSYSPYNPSKRMQNRSKIFR